MENEMENLKKGDKVKCINPIEKLEKNKIYTFVEYSSIVKNPFADIYLEEIGSSYMISRFEKVKEEEIQVGDKVRCISKNCDLIVGKIYIVKKISYYEKLDPHLDYIYTNEDNCNGYRYRFEKVTEEKKFCILYYYDNEHKVKVHFYVPTEDYLISKIESLQKQDNEIQEIEVYELVKVKTYKKNTIWEKTNF